MIEFAIRRTFHCFALALCAVAALTSCASKSKKEGLTADQVYEQAKRDLSSSDYGNAIRLYEQLESRYPFANIARQGQLDLMYAYYMGRETESAEDQADQFIRENPAHPRVDYAYYIKGLATFEGVPNFVERWFRADLAKRPPLEARKSFQALQTLVQRFPNSEYAPDSRQRMVFLRNRLADYEISVASYYLDRGAYVGAINRSKFALENYDGAPSMAEALSIMVEAYEKLGMPDLSANAQKVLAENFPDAVKKKGWFR